MIQSKWYLKIYEFEPQKRRERAYVKNKETEGNEKVKEEMKKEERKRKNIHKFLITHVCFENENRIVYLFCIVTQNISWPL